MSTPNDPTLVEQIEKLLHPEAEAAGTLGKAETAAADVVAVVNTAASMATAAEPVVAAIDPPAGVEIAVAVAVLNSLEAIGGWLGLIPDGTAKQGLQAEISKIRSLVQP